MLWMLWMLWLLTITGVSCHVWSDVDTGERYLETTVVVEASDTLPYQVTIVVNEDRTTSDALVLYSDTLSGGGHITPSHPLPEIEGDSLFMIVRLEPLQGQPVTGLAACVLDEGGG